MPFYDFICDNPESPYHKIPYTVMMSIKKYLEEKDNMKCPVTGLPMRPKIGTQLLKFKGGRE